MRKTRLVLAFLVASFLAGCDLLNSPTVELLFNPEQVSVSVDRATIEIGTDDVATIVVQLKDRSGTDVAVADIDIALAVTGGALADDVVTTDATGRASTTLTTLGTETVETRVTITASYETESGSTFDLGTPQYVTFLVPYPGSASSLTVDPSTLEILPGDQATLTVQLLRQDGAPLAIPGLDVTFAASLGVLGATTVQTDAMGVATTTLTPPAGILSDVEATVEAFRGATADPAQSIDAKTVTFSIEEPIAASTLSASAGIVQFNASGTASTVVTAQLRRADGTALALAGVGIRFTASAGTLGATTVLTDEAGVASTTLTQPVADEVDVVVDVDAFLGSTSLQLGATQQVRFSVADPLTLSTLTITGGVESHVDGGGFDAVLEMLPGDVGTLTVQLTDDSGNPIEIAGLDVTLATTAGTLGSSSLVTDANGRVTTTLTAPAATGSTDIPATVTAYLGTAVDASQEIDDVSVLFSIEATLDQSTVSLGRDELEALAEDTTTARVQLKRGNGDDLMLAGVDVRLVASAGSLSASSLVTDYMGVATAILTPTEADVVDATVSGYLGTIVNEARLLGSTQLVTFIWQASLDASDVSVDSAVFGIDDTTPVAVQLRRANGDPIARSGVSIALTSTNGTLNAGVVTTDSDGIASTSITLPSDAEDDVSAEVEAFLGTTVVPALQLGAPDTATFFLQDVTIDITGATVEYDGTEQPLVYTFTVVGGTSDPADAEAASAFVWTNLGTGTAIPGVPSDAGSYRLTITADFPYRGSDAADLVIEPRTLTVTSPVFADKAYDASSAATLSADLDTTNVVEGDEVCLGTEGCASVDPQLNGVFQVFSGGMWVASAAVQTYDDDASTRVLGTIALSGADAANYVLTQPTGSAEITAIELTFASGPTATNRVYDGTTDATIPESLVGVLPADEGQVEAVGAFDTKDVGTAKDVTITLSGARSGNYVFASTVTTTVAADVTARPITITADDETVTYSNNATTGSGQTTFQVGSTDDPVTGLIDGEGSDWTVTITASPDDDDGQNGACRDVGSYSLTPSALTGTGVSNYVVDAADYVAGTLTVQAYTIAALTGSPSITAKQYDGNTSVASGDLGMGTLAIPDEACTVRDQTASRLEIDLTGATATYGSSAVGTGKTVTVTGVALGGTDAGNYILTQTTYSDTAAAIDRRKTKLLVSNAPLQYDGSKALGLLVVAQNPAPDDVDSVIYEATYSFGGVPVTEIRDAGTYVVTLSIREDLDSRYTLVDGDDGGGASVTTLDVEVEVNPRVIDVTGVVAETTFGLTNIAPILSELSTDTTLGFGDGLTGTLDIAGSGDVVDSPFNFTIGTVTVERGGVDVSSNYTITVSGNLAVTPANVEFSLTNADEEGLVYRCLADPDPSDPEDVAYRYDYTGTAIGLSFASDPSGVAFQYTIQKIKDASGNDITPVGVGGIVDEGTYEISVVEESTVTNYDGSTVLTVVVGSTLPTEAPTECETFSYTDADDDSLSPDPDVEITALAGRITEAGLVVTLTTFAAPVELSGFIEVDLDGSKLTGSTAVTASACPAATDGIDLVIQFAVAPTLEGGVLAFAYDQFPGSPLAGPDDGLAVSVDGAVTTFTLSMAALAAGGFPEPGGAMQAVVVLGDLGGTVAYDCAGENVGTAIPAS